jgi:GGDEF domain-containing protein
MLTSQTSARAEGPEALQARFSTLLALQRGRMRAAWAAAGAAAALAVLFVLWIIPWPSFGMTADDYSPAVAVALLLALGIAVMTVVAALLRDLAVGGTDVADIFRMLLGRTMRLRNRHQFANRLARECARATRDRRLGLSLVLVHAGQGEGDAAGSPHTLDRVANALAATVRASDVVGIVGDTEIGVLAIGAGDDARELIRDRFERTLASAIPTSEGPEPSDCASSVWLGASTFGLEDDPDSLLAAARRDLRQMRRGTVQAT